MSDITSFFTPIQIATTLGAAMNFGGSVLQSPLIMPMLRDVDVPVHYAAAQTAYLLHNSEHFFPPLNALCSLGNLILTGVSYYYSTQGNVEAGNKFPRLAVAFGCNVATTAWALGFMVPMNKRMTALSGELEIGVGKGEGKEAGQLGKAREFRALQRRWETWNLGRATIMLASAVAGALALIA